MPEIEQGLVDANKGAPVSFSFTPHLLPMTRGILSTMYVSLAAGVTADDLQAELGRVYADQPFVHVLVCARARLCTSNAALAGAASPIIALLSAPLSLSLSLSLSSAGPNGTVPVRSSQSV